MIEVLAQHSSKI